jgi:hypothetical protein
VKADRRLSAASSPGCIRALKSDVEAFDRGDHLNNRLPLPATPEIAGNLVDARQGRGQARLAWPLQGVDRQDPSAA